MKNLQFTNNYYSLFNLTKYLYLGKWNHQSLMVDMDVTECLHNR